MVDHFGLDSAASEEEVLDLALHTEAMWAIPSVRLEDPRQAARLGGGEFAWNTYKNKPELEGALASGVVTLTGQTVDQGYYRDLPVVRLQCHVDPLTKECTPQTQATMHAEKAGRQRGDAPSCALPDRLFMLG